MLKLKVIAEALEAGHLDSRVFKAQSGVQVGPYLTKDAGIRHKGFETVTGQPDVEGMAGSERVLAKTEVLPAMEHPREHAQIRVCPKDRARTRLHAPVQGVPRPNQRGGGTLVAPFIDARPLALDEQIVAAKVIEMGL